MYEIMSLTSTFKVNGHRLKPYFDANFDANIEYQALKEPPPLSWSSPKYGRPAEDIKLSASWEATHVLKNKVLGSGRPNCIKREFL